MIKWMHIIGAGVIVYAAYLRFTVGTEPAYAYGLYGSALMAIALYWKVWKR